MPVKNKSLYIIIGILLFTIIPFVSCASPFTQSGNNDGLILNMPFNDVLKVNNGYDVNVHVFNKSTGMPVYTTTIKCVLHLYNRTGDHIYSGVMDRDTVTDHLVTNEWVTRLNGGNFTSTGLYTAMIQCNNSILGGAVQQNFDVTPNGYVATVGRAIFDVSLLSILVVFLITSLVFFISFESLNMRVGMLGIAYLLLIAITFIGWQLAGDFLVSAPFLISMLRILFIVLVIGLFPLVVGGFAYYFIMVSKIKEIERLMGKGMDYDDAERRQGRKYK